MKQRQAPCMKQLPRRGETGGLVKAGTGPPPINQIAGNGEPQMREVNADLMSSARMKRDFHQRGVAPALQHAITGPGLAAARPETAIFLRCVGCREMAASMLPESRDTLPQAMAW